MMACKLLKRWWPGTELNRRRQPFQGCALPAELPGHPLLLTLTCKSERRCYGLTTYAIIAALPRLANEPLRSYPSPIAASRRTMSHERKAMGKIGLAGSPLHAFRVVGRNSVFPANSASVVWANMSGAVCINATGAGVMLYKLKC